MGYLLLGFLLVIAGGAGSIFLNRRAFYRRNAAGLEEFKSFGSMFKSRIIEGGIAIFSYLVLAIGAVLVIVGFSNL